MHATDPSHLVDLIGDGKTQGPCERGPEFIGMAEFGSGAKLEGRDHRVACTPRSPHETALLHPLLHPPGVQIVHPPCQESPDSASPRRLPFARDWTPCVRGGESFGHGVNECHHVVKERGEVFRQSRDDVRAPSPGGPS